MIWSLLESEEKIVNDMKGKTIEEKISNIIKWFMHNEISDKPINTLYVDPNKRKEKLMMKEKIKQSQLSQRKKTKAKYQV